MPPHPHSFPTRRSSDLAAAQMADVQVQSDATRDASITRIRELEAELAATRSAAAAQIADVHAEFDATRDASAARIRELEAEIAAARAAANKPTGPTQMFRRIAGRLRRAAGRLRHDTWRGVGLHGLDAQRAAGRGYVGADAMAWKKEPLTRPLCPPLLPNARFSASKMSAKHSSSPTPLSVA